MTNERYLKLKEKYFQYSESVPDTGESFTDEAVAAGMGISIAEYHEWEKVEEEESYRFLGRIL